MFRVPAMYCRTLYLSACTGLDEETAAAAMAAASSQPGGAAAQLRSQLTTKQCQAQLSLLLLLLSCDVLLLHHASPRLDVSWLGRLRASGTAAALLTRARQMLRAGAGSGSDVRGVAREEAGSADCTSCGYGATLRGLASLLSWRQPMHPPAMVVAVMQVRRNVCFWAGRASWGQCLQLLLNGSSKPSRFEKSYRMLMKLLLGAVGIIFLSQAYALLPP